MRVVHDKEIFFNDETSDHNIIYLPNLFESKQQELNEEILFSLNSLGLSGDLNIPNRIDKALNGAENVSWKNKQLQK